MQQQHFTEPEPRTIARRNDPETSKAAADRVGEFAAKHREQITDALRVAPDGLTIHEIATATGLDHHAVGRRMGEMQQVGLVFVAFDGNGEQVTRPTPSGRSARVWRFNAKRGAAQ